MGEWWDGGSGGSSSCISVRHGFEGYGRPKSELSVYV